MKFLHTSSNFTNSIGSNDNQRNMKIVQKESKKTLHLIKVNLCY